MTQSSSVVLTSDSPQIRDAARVEELMRDVTGESGTPNALMHEHLEAARYYLIGSMPEELRLTLDMVRHLLPALPDPSLRNRIGEFLESQRSPRA